MNKEVIKSENAPDAVGPYSQGMKYGNIVFTSGQLPVDMKTGKLQTDIKLATKACLENCQAILLKKDVTLDNVIKTTVFLDNMENFSAMNEVYAEYFKNNCPTRSCIQAAKLPKGAIIEIEVIAVL